MAPRVACFTTAVLVLVMGAATALPLAAQRAGNARIEGIVLDAVTRLPVAGVQVVLLGASRSIATDSSGRFRFEALEDGEYALQIRSSRGDSATARVALGPRERVDLEFYLGARLGVDLPEVVVTASSGSNSGRDAFERRLAEGNGRFITREYIERRRPQDLMDLMRGVAGMRVDCNTDRYRCVMQFGRSPRNCAPQYYLDGVRSHPSILYLTLPTDVVGIEIYSGAAQVPAEFSGQTSRCGVIAIWTNNGRGGPP